MEGDLGRLHPRSLRGGARLVFAGHIPLNPREFLGLRLLVCAPWAPPGYSERPSSSAHTPMQPSLFDLDTLGFDRTFSRLERIRLDETAWVDVAPGWVTGSDALFRTLVETLPWA